MAITLHHITPLSRRATIHFAPVRINETLETLAPDFDDADSFDIHHYSFKVHEEEFNAIIGRIKSTVIPYGSEPYALVNMAINHRHGGRGVFLQPERTHS